MEAHFQNCFEQMWASYKCNSALGGVWGSCASQLPAACPCGLGGLAGAAPWAEEMACFAEPPWEVCTQAHSGGEVSTHLGRIFREQNLEMSTVLRQGEVKLWSSNPKQECFPSRVVVNCCLYHCIFILPLHKVGVSVLSHTGICTDICVGLVNDLNGLVKKLKREGERSADSRKLFKRKAGSKVL